ncbi:MAG: cyclic nucleotide-binding domain-containing protein [Bacteriovoracaceae bacterium]|nr:cyclic nucleotide-binding domain-containing protein [Bacteriovoracaceae bacterium]
MSYENDVKAKVLKNENIPDKLDIGLLKYLWQAGPFNINKEDSIPRFLTKVSALNEFTDNELRIFSKFLHKRQFSRDEYIFKQGDAGYGFYFVFSGSVGIIHLTGKGADLKEHTVAKLERSQYFGEMGLLEEYNRRNASAICLENTILLGLFKPDLEALLDRYPVVGAKFMREISLILAQRVGGLMQEISTLRHSLGENGAIV